MRITRFSRNEHGDSEFSEVEIAYPDQLAGYGLAISASLVSPALEFATLPKGIDQAQHPVPRRQLVVVLQGLLEVGTPDGEFRLFKPGDVFLADDTDTAGHTTRTVDGVVELLWISIPHGAAWESI